MTSTSVRWNERTIHIRNFDNHFLLLRAADGSSVTALGRVLYERGFEFIREVIVTETEICVQLNERFLAAPADWLSSLPADTIIVPTVYRLPVHFGAHEDWAAVTAHVGLARSEIIARLLAVEYTVAMFGFLPGFVYLDGLPSALHVPRKAVPAKYVSAGSVAIGGKYLGVYALDSPGGWHVIGRVPVTILQTDTLPPVPLRLTDRIHLVEVKEAEFTELVARGEGILEYNKS